MYSVISEYTLKMHGTVLIKTVVHLHASVYLYASVSPHFFSPAQSPTDLSETIVPLTNSFSRSRNDPSFGSLS